MKSFSLKRNGKYFQRGFCFHIGIFNISGVYIGFKKVDLRISIRWGW